MNLTSIKDKFAAFASSNKHWIWVALIGVLLFGGGFVAGRFATPAKVVTTEKIRTVEVEKVVVQTKTEVQVVKVADTATIRKLHRVITELTKPDGTKQKTTTEDSGVDSVVHTQEHDTEVRYVDRVVEKQVEKLVEKTKLVMNQPGWSVYAGAGVSVPYFLGQASPGIPGMSGAVVQLGVDRRVAGPFWFGLFGNTQGVVGANLRFTW